MVNINFVPDDYIHNNESHRTNLIYLVLLVAVMVALGGSFVTIRMRQGACKKREELVNQRMAQTQETMRQIEALQVKRREMMKTALTTTELLESVPRSVLLAALTNNLPAGVSLMDLELIQKEPKNVNQAVAATSKFDAAQSETKAVQKRLSMEKLLQTNIDIEGVATNDLQVAEYIRKLSISNLLDNVALVESKEYKVDESTFRQFKLTAMLKSDVHLSKEDVDSIKTQAESSMWNF